MHRLLTAKEGERSFPWLWFLRVVGIVLSIIVLGLTASNVASFYSGGCSPPQKLEYNLAVAVISFVLLIYLLLSSGPARQTKILPWIIWAQLAIDAILFVLWLAAGSSSQLNCADLCNACSGNDYVYYGDLYCTCFYLYKKSDTSPALKSPLLTKRRSYHSSHSTDDSGSGSVSATTAFDAILTVLFAVCLASTVFWLFQARRMHRMGQSGPTNAAGTTTTPNGPIKHEEAGLAPPNNYNNDNNMMINNTTPGYTQPSPAYSPQQQQQPQTSYSQPGYTAPPNQGQYPPQAHQYSESAAPQYPQYPPQTTQTHVSHDSPAPIASTTSPTSQAVNASHGEYPPPPQAQYTTPPPQAGHVEMPSPRDTPTQPAAAAAAADHSATAPEVKA